MIRLLCCAGKTLLRGRVNKELIKELSRIFRKRVKIIAGLIQSKRRS